MRLVVGLGNPGKQYEKTRHNIGWMVVDRCCARRGIEPTRKAHEARYAVYGIGREQTVFMKPLTYMNLSGQAIRAFVDFYQIEPADVLVVCDDLALPVGQLRLRAGGSSGGQKGLESTIRHLGTDRFPRLRVGIGAPPPYMDAADYVLGRFAGEDEQKIAEAIERAADAVNMWIREGVEATQAKFNVRAREAGETKEAGGAGANGSKGRTVEKPKDKESEGAGHEGGGPG